MNSLPVRLLASAVADLEQIEEFLIEIGAAPRVARGYIGRIESHCDKMGRTPLGGSLAERLGPNLRMTFFERQVSIVYRPMGDRVEIVRVFYAGRDYERLFR